MLKGDLRNPGRSIGATDRRFRLLAEGRCRSMLALMTVAERMQPLDRCRIPGAETPLVSAEEKANGPTRPDRQAQLLSRSGHR
jgi:hypothetical protein